MLLPVHRLQLFTKNSQNCHHFVTQRLAGGRNICKEAEISIQNFWIHSVREWMREVSLLCNWTESGLKLTAATDDGPAFRDHLGKYMEASKRRKRRSCCRPQRFRANSPLLLRGATVTSSPSVPWGREHSSR